MQDNIVRLGAWLATLFGLRPGGRHSRRRLPGAGQVSMANRPSRGALAPVDMGAGRARRWQRRGLVPPPWDWAPKPVAQGVYIPPEPWHAAAEASPARVGEVQR